MFILLFFNTKYKTFSFLRLINDFFKRKTRLVTQPQFNVYRVYYASYVAYTFICISLKHRMLLFVDILSTKFVMVPATSPFIQKWLLFKSLFCYIKQYCVIRLLCSIISLFAVACRFFIIRCISSILIADNDVTIHNISQQVFRIDVIQVVISYIITNFRFNNTT